MKFKLFKKTDSPPSQTTSHSFVSSSSLITSPVKKKHPSSSIGLKQQQNKTLDYTGEEDIFRQPKPTTGITNLNSITVVRPKTNNKPNNNNKTIDCLNTRQRTPSSVSASQKFLLSVGYNFPKTHFQEIEQLAKQHMHEKEQETKEDGNITAETLDSSSFDFTYDNKNNNNSVVKENQCETPVNKKRKSVNLESSKSKKNLKLFSPNLSPSCLIVSPAYSSTSNCEELNKALEENCNIETPKTNTTTVNNNNDVNNVVDNLKPIYIQEIEKKNILLLEKEKEIKRLTEENEKLKQFKLMMEKLDGMPDMLYSRATEILCDAWVNKKSSSDELVKTLQQAMNYMKVSAFLGNIEAVFEYGELLLKHTKTKKNEALQYFEQASNLGHHKAKLYLKLLKSKINK